MILEQRLKSRTPNFLIRKTEKSREQSYLFRNKQCFIIARLIGFEL